MALVVLGVVGKELRCEHDAHGVLEGARGTGEGDASAGTVDCWASLCANRIGSFRQNIALINF